MSQSTPTRRRPRVYVACADDNEIAVFTFDPDDGGLAPVQRIAVEPGLTPLALHPRRDVLYAGLRGTAPAIVAFAIDSASGLLERRASVRLADPPMCLALDTGGAYLFSASYANGTFAIHAVDGEGGIAPSPVARTVTPPRAHAIRTDPADRYLFVTALGADAILQYVFDPATGRAQPNAIPRVQLPAGSGPRHFVVHPHADLFYVNGELDGSLTSLALDPQTGRLTPVAGASVFAGAPPETPWGADLVVRPDGRFLYASERRTSVVAVFALDGEPGAMRRVASMPTEEQPRALALDPQGRFLIVAGERSQHLGIYAVDPDSGALEPRHRIAVGQKPVWVLVAEPPHESP